MTPDKKSPAIKIFYVLFGILCTAQIASFFSTQFWLSDVLSEFALHYFLGFLGAFCILVLLKKHWVALISLGGIAINGLAIMPLFLPPSACIHCDSPLLQIVQYNLYYKNRGVKDFVTWALADKDTAIIILSEAETNQAMLEPLKKGYPYFTGPEKHYPSGLAVFSRIPLEDVQWTEIVPGVEENKDLLSVAVTLADRKQPLRIFAIHPRYSLTPEDRRQRNAYLPAIARMMHETPESYKIIAGDFNTTPWSNILVQTQRLSGLRNAQNGLGFFTSWHYYPEWRNLLDGLMLDQMLVSDNIYIEKRFAGSDFGSDHLPVITRLQLQTAY